MSVLRRARSRRPCAGALLGAVALGAAGAAPAPAAIAPPALVDGPSAAIVDLGGVAMAPDGSAGLVYRKRVDGRARIFAARFDGTAWSEPQRVDVGQRFDSSWPQIAAGDGGRLLVSWVQELGAGVDRMFSAALGPGARRFQPPTVVDLNVGEATATFPSLAMNAAGTAYLAYRVVHATSQANATLPRGSVDADVRLARTTGSLWSVVGQPLDRNPIAPVAAPTAANSPRVGVDRSGNAVLAWQEPDDAGIDRVWARRVFGSSPGIALQASPTRLGAATLAAGADAFALAVAGFGQAAIAYRQRADAAAGVAVDRVFTSTIPEAFSDRAATFAPARIADGAGGAGPPPGLGVPSVSVAPRGELRLAYGAGTASFAVVGDDDAAGAAVRLDDGGSAVAGDPVVELGGDGAAATAWKTLQGARGGVAVQERRADGVVVRGLLSAPGGGVVADLRSAGSGLGDAAVAFLQGTGAGAQVAAAVVDAPPQQFSVQTPPGFTRAARIAISWDPAEHAIGGVRYDVTSDDEQVASDLRATRATLRAAALGDGLHTIVVTATDGAGQPTESVPAQLGVDRRAPRIALRRRGRALTVGVSDGPRSAGSGLRSGATRATFGDGRRTIVLRGRARHVYRRPGRYRVTVTSRDRAGNGRTLRRSVRVP